MKNIILFLAGLIALPAIGLISGLFGFLPSKATATPSQWEAGIAMRALDASLEKRASGAKNPVKPEDKGALAAGAKLYQQKCSGCHGNAKGPSSWGANDFYPRVPQFFQEGTDVNSEEAYAAIHDGIRYSGMAAWGDQLTDRQIWQVANFVSQIKAPAGMEPGMR
jgi:mono/diheme cytochrome c family protein